MTSRAPRSGWDAALSFATVASRRSAQRPCTQGAALEFRFSRARRASHPDRDRGRLMSSPDRTRARQLARESLARGDDVGWFERLYDEAAGEAEVVPWADMRAN